MSSKKQIKISDCTLRDGGYINNWNFGREAAENIMLLLNKAGADFIEAGFLTAKSAEVSSNYEKTLYSSFSQAERFIPEKIEKSKISAMIKYGDFPIELVPDAENSKIGSIKVCFKKKTAAEALEYCAQISRKGYKIFINPAFTNEYNDEEFIQLLKNAGKINPFCISIVDSAGCMTNDDIIHYYNLIDKNVSSETAVCLHTHNNMQLSFSNAKRLIKTAENRKIIIDAAVSGMGRGAGNLSALIIMHYLNECCSGNYNTAYILEAAEKYINPVYPVMPRRYYTAYCLSAVNKCHPDYAEYLADKNISSVLTGEILKALPENKKSVYDCAFISELCKKRASE